MSGIRVSPRVNSGTRVQRKQRRRAKILRRSHSPPLVSVEVSEEVAVAAVGEEDEAEELFRPRPRRVRRRPLPSQSLPRRPLRRLLQVREEIYPCNSTVLLYIRMFYASVCRHRFPCNRVYMRFSICPVYGCSARRFPARNNFCERRRSEARRLQPLWLSRPTVAVLPFSHLDPLVFPHIRHGTRRSSHFKFTTVTKPH